MKINRFIVLAILVFLLSARRIHQAAEEDHFQQSTTEFVCCPDTYIFDSNQLACICPPENPFVDVQGKCISCSKPK